MSNFIKFDENEAREVKALEDDDLKMLSFSHGQEKPYSDSTKDEDTGKEEGTVDMLEVRAFVCLL